MGEERSSEHDDEMSEHRVLWTGEPGKYPSSRPPALPRTTLEMVRHRESAETSRLVSFAQSAPPPPRFALPRVELGARSLDPRLLLLTDPDSPRAAAFRVLRDNLVARGLPAVIAVSSATAHEGKTTCAVNLALALSETRAGRVLILDANSFVPGLAQLFSIDEHTHAEPSPHAPWVAPFKMSELTPTLHVATIVRPRGELMPRLDDNRFGLVLARLRAMGYRHVIVDAPALDGAPSVRSLLSAVDGVLLTVRAGRSTARAVRRAVAQLRPGRAIGFALLDASDA
jgi:Mrp family chromosome partitioning ATPase